MDVAKREIYISKKGKEISGFDNCGIGTVTLDEFHQKIVQSDQQEVEDKFQQYLNKEIDTFEVKCRIKVSDDKYTWISLRGRGLCNEEGEVIRIAGSLNNINKEKVAEAKINRLAYYDPLTDLPNRAYFAQLMETMITEKKLEKFALLFIDIDNFSAVNESLGHSCGDQILCNISEILKKQMVFGNELVRFGGDEFVIVVKNVVSNAQLKAYVEQILKEFQKPFEIGGENFHITLSMGISTYPFDGETAEKILKHADIALNNVKAHGKNGYKLFSFELDESVAKRLKLERDLRKAVENKEFELFYQPKFDIGRNQVLGYEALLRWHHPKRGLVSPLEFIPVAEETGLIIPIGEWVIQKAAEQLYYWQQQGHAELTIAVNLSARQFKDERLVDRFRQIRKTTGVDLTKLELEITETTALYDIQYAINVLRELKELGLKISLDDFGTGYSSLNYLTQLPIDHLKIDKSFLKNTIEQKSGEQIIRSVIGLAHACNLKVVAEGVETRGQLDFLRDEKCDMIQGFYISRPVPKHEAIVFMNANIY
ncbi:EAL domain-containing protein [Armatimonadetes bacterium]|nr:EAL domain-containing protein [bacterium]